MRKKERQKRVRMIQKAEEKRKNYNKTHPEEVKERREMQRLARKHRLSLTDKRRLKRIKNKRLKRLKVLWKRRDITAEKYQEEVKKINKELQELK